jgi:6-pyruvoyltetrahydropterin/6-carboxytetrahydropterin synthase
MSGARQRKSMATIEVGVIGSFESAHSLKGEYFGKASKLHGHTYRVEVVAKGRQLTKNGILCDIVELKENLDLIIDKFHYAILDEIPELKETKTTAEALARFIQRQIGSKLRDRENIDSIKVTVWENQAAFGSFEDKI